MCPGTMPRPPAAPCRHLCWLVIGWAIWGLLCAQNPGAARPARRCGTPSLTKPAAAPCRLPGVHLSTGCSAGCRKPAQGVCALQALQRPTARRCRTPHAHGARLQQCLAGVHSMPRTSAQTHLTWMLHDSPPAVGHTEATFVQDAKDLTSSAGWGLKSWDQGQVYAWSWPHRRLRTPPGSSLSGHAAAGAGSAHLYCTKLQTCARSANSCNVAGWPYWSSWLATAPGLP